VRSRAADGRRPKSARRIGSPRTTEPEIYDLRFALVDLQSPIGTQQSTIGNRKSAIDNGGLLRVIGVRRLVAGAINATIGAGIFVLPATVAAGLGPAAPLAYVLCGGMMVLIILCFAAAGSRVTSTGGLYAYVEAAFGPFVGFLTGVLYCLSASLAAASVASACAASMAAAWPVAATTAARFGLLTALVAGLAVVNLRGVTPGARLVEAVTLAKLLPLVVLIVAGVWFVRGERLVFTTLPAASTVGRTAIVLIFAFVGVEVALVPSGEVSDPARTVPRALFLALAATTVIYLAIQTVALGLLGPSMADYPAAPLAEAMARVAGRGGRLFVLAGATISMFGYLAGDMLGSPRALFALARDRMLPAPLARVHRRFHTPYVAIVTYATIVGAAAVSSSFTELAIVTNVSTLSMYLLCVLASYELQRRDVRGGGTPFAMPGGPLLPMLATAAILWLLSHATSREVALEGVVLGIASAFYAIASISRSRRETSASS
jgi:APA family basic amino acid/polyamine antiporter